MPWDIVKDDDRCPADRPYAVVGGSTGRKLFGCHPDAESARNQQKALYAQEGSSSEDHADVQVAIQPVVAFTTPPTIAW